MGKKIPVEIQTTTSHLELGRFKITIQIVFQMMQLK